MSEQRVVSLTQRRLAEPAAAIKEQLSYPRFLAESLLAELDDRDRRSSARRVKAARFPKEKWLGDFDVNANPAIEPATIHHFAAGDWIRRGEPLCPIGDSGTGKSHLLIGLGPVAAEQGHRVRYTLATRLVNELVEAADEKTLAKTIARYGRVDLLIIDDLATWNWVVEVPSSSSKCAPNARSRTASPSPPTNPSPAGPTPSRTHACAQPSSKPAPTPTDSHTPATRPERRRSVADARCGR
jgi:hypothetical protein